MKNALVSTNNFVQKHRVVITLTSIAVVAVGARVIARGLINEAAENLRVAIESDAN